MQPQHSQPALSSIALEPARPKTYGSPIAKTIDPFTSSDLFQSFTYGLVWGGAAILLLALGAWLVSVMRRRVYFSAHPATTEDPAVRSINYTALNHYTTEET
jgi:hypothetical protein